MGPFLIKSQLNKFQIKTFSGALNIYESWQKFAIFPKTYVSTLSTIKTILSDPMFNLNNRNQSYMEENLKSNYYETRIWKKLSSNNPDNIGLKFKVVSYNILSQELMVEHLYLYKKCNPAHLKWNYRLARLTEKIVEQKPDILCLQEVEEDALREILESIKFEMPSMLYVFKKKTGLRTDGCAIIYNCNLFELVCSDYVEFFRPDISLLNRHNIALFGKFRCKLKKEAHLLVGTTHLVYNPKREDVRLAQTMVLLAELDQHSILKPEKLDRMPIILTGDFNFKADSAPFQLIHTGQLVYEGLTKGYLSKPETHLSPLIGKHFLSNRLRITDNCQYIDCDETNYENNPQQSSSFSDESNPKNSHLFSTGSLSHSLNLKSVYDHCDGVSYGSVFQSRWVTVDHMFYTRSNKMQEATKKIKLVLDSVYQLPNERQCRRLGCLPNEQHGSDHLKIAACFSLIFPKEKNK